MPIDLKDKETLLRIVNILTKARRKMSDEYDPYDDTPKSETEGLREFDPEEEETAGADWLKENDPSSVEGKD